MGDPVKTGGGDSSGAAEEKVDDKKDDDEDDDDVDMFGDDDDVGSHYIYITVIYNFQLQSGSVSGWVCEFYTIYFRCNVFTDMVCFAHCNVNWVVLQNTSRCA